MAFMLLNPGPWGSPVEFLLAAGISTLGGPYVGVGNLVDDSEQTTEAQDREERGKALEVNFSLMAQLPRVVEEGGHLL